MEQLIVLSLVTLIGVGLLGSMMDAVAEARDRRGRDEIVIVERRERPRTSGCLLFALGAGWGIVLLLALIAAAR